MRRISICVFTLLLAALPLAACKFGPKFVITPDKVLMWQETSKSAFVLLTPDTAKDFAKVTGENAGKPIRIYVGRTFHSQPTINERIDSGRISLSLTPENRKDILDALPAGKKRPLQ